MTAGTVPGSRGETLHVGVFLPSIGTIGGATFPVAAAARVAEEHGFDSVWVGDHLSFHTPLVEAFVAAATAAAATSRVEIGFGVLLLALRQPAWAAKQLASLQVVSGDRCVLGVGIGGENPVEWTAAGVDRGRRGKRTDAVLEVLPDLLSGKATVVPEPVALDLPPIEPHGAVPPVWIGGRGPAALRRAARFGDGWLGMWLDEARARTAVAELRVLSGHRPAPPRPGALVFCGLGVDAEAAHDQAAAALETQYQLPYQRMRRYIAAGTPARVTDFLSRLADAGLSRFVLFPTSSNWERDYEQLAEVRRRLIDRHRVTTLEGT